MNYMMSRISHRFDSFRFITNVLQIMPSIQGLLALYSYVANSVSAKDRQILEKRCIRS